MEGIRSARIEAALVRAVDAGDTAELFDLLARSSGLPGPRPNVDLGDAVAVALAVRRRGADLTVRALADSESEYHALCGALALGARWAAGVDAKASVDRLQALAEDPRRHVRGAVVRALRRYVERHGPAGVDALVAWTDGYLQAHAVLEALAERTLLASLPSAEPVLARLDEAFALADRSPRAAERSEGVRTLRRELPRQIAVLAGRFSEVVTWLGERTATARPESRDVVEEAIRALRKSATAFSETDRLTASLAASAPAPRDPTRIVQGTRKRSKGRR
jgi:hypothetical protein